jgi:hypothetical protein
MTGESEGSFFMLSLVDFKFNVLEGLCFSRVRHKEKKGFEKLDLRKVDTLKQLLFCC